MLLALCLSRFYAVRIGMCAFDMRFKSQDKLGMGKCRNSVVKRLPGTSFTVPARWKRRLTMFSLLVKCFSR
ncbi:hypothetical protein FA10DRAFT_264717 [Acaromyces ingoldii]|uniref:Uncharacterized protein n=1 Tax=Acaromyces ingoldii TaxID=215250 RepID=A0A316Z1T9_9BASI|nr:hypothetical protein FA10DRAFT_264717 [Acaromyces ingoldii]PWN94143.1 hypothetical protein FA10DRAFT_264717 [Acaromyces ingoldii]